MTRTCALPGCHNVLRTYNISTLCKDHTHTRPYCKCARCTGRSKEQLLKKRGPLPANVRQAVVTSTTGFSTSDGLKTLVSLPREPWA